MLKVEVFHKLRWPEVYFLDFSLTEYIAYCLNLN